MAPMEPEELFEDDLELDNDAADWDEDDPDWDESDAQSVARELGIVTSEL